MAEIATKSTPRRITIKKRDDFDGYGKSVVFFPSVSSHGYFAVWSRTQQQKTHLINIFFYFDSKPTTT